MAVGWTLNSVERGDPSTTGVSRELTGVSRELTGVSRELTGVSRELGRFY